MQHLILYVILFVLAFFHRDLRKKVEPDLHANQQEHITSFAH